MLQFMGPFNGILHFSLCALRCNCYRLEQQNSPSVMLKLVLLQNSYLFRASRSIISECGCTKQSLNYAVTSNVLQCGELITVAIYRGKCVHNNQSSIYVAVCVRQYRDCDDLITMPYVGDNSRLWRLIVQLHSLVMGR